MSLVCLQADLQGQPPPAVSPAVLCSYVIVNDVNGPDDENTSLS